MKRLVALLAGAALIGSSLTGATAGPTQGGFASDNIEYVGNIPFETASSTGVSIIGKYMYLTSWKNLSIYDVSNPVAPKQLAIEPIGFQFENEDVDSNGKIMIFSESTPQSILHVWDVEDKTNPVEIATVAGGGDHTGTCVLNCKWVFGSDGALIDLRNPSKPKLQPKSWHTIPPINTMVGSGVHDLEEYKRGFVLVSTLDKPFFLMDVRNPLKPRPIALADKHPEPWGATVNSVEGNVTDEGGFLFHSGKYPRKGKDKFLLMQGENNFRVRCTEKNVGPFMTWKKKGKNTYTMVDEYQATNGTYQDGNPAVAGFGCSAHWFDPHPAFKNGGLVALGYYEHGTKILNVDSKGKIKELGWFQPYGGATSAAYWVSTDKQKRIIYSVDYQRGLDILRYTGKL
jgi:LVIVD repeat